jgi:addiction module RelE/StbE family toxin
VTEVRWTEQAVADLAAIKAFIAQDSPAYALAVVERLYHAVGQLARFPESGRIVPEQARADIRELIRPPYRIVYRRRPELVEVLLVFRSSLPLPRIPNGGGAG